jgi:hypothetical protein
MRHDEWPLRLYYIFFILSHRRHDFRDRERERETDRRLLNINCVLIFSTTFVWNISHSKNWASHDQKCIGLVCMRSTHYSFRISTKHGFFFSRFLKNIQISYFTRIRPVGAEAFHADRHNEANSRFSQSCERELKKNLY